MKICMLKEKMMSVSVVEMIENYKTLFVFVNKVITILANHMMKKLAKNVNLVAKLVIKKVVYLVSKTENY